MSNCIAYSKPGEDLFVTFTHVWCIRGVCGLGAGVGLFLLFLGAHMCKRALLLSHLFHYMMHFYHYNPTNTLLLFFHFSSLHFSPPPFPSLVLGNSITALCWWNLFSVYSCKKGWAPGCYCMSLKWCRCYRFHRRPWMLNESEAEWRRMVGRWVRVWAHVGKEALELKIRHFIALYSPLVPLPWWWKTPLQMKDGNEQQQSDTKANLKQRRGKMRLT